MGSNLKFWRGSTATGLSPRNGLTNLRLRDFHVHTYIYSPYRTTQLLIPTHPDPDIPFIHSVTATKSLKGSSPLTYDSRMDLGLSWGRIQTSEISQTPLLFATKHFSVDPIPATHFHTRLITYLHTP